MLENQTVVALVVGLSKDPGLIVRYIHELHRKMWIDDLRFGNMDSERLNQLRDQNKFPFGTLFTSLYGESTTALPGCWNHNEHLNLFGERDQLYKTFTGRATPVYFPSKVYVFSIEPGNEAPGDIQQHEGCSEIPECAMMIGIYAHDATMTKRVLSLCREISKQQAVTDFCMSCDGCVELTEAEVPILNKNIQSVKVIGSKLSASFVRSILHQLFDCLTLKSIDLHFMDLHEIETDLDQLLENLSGHCLRQKTELRLIVTESMVSTSFIKKWAYRRQETGIYFHDKPKKEDTSK